MKFTAKDFIGSCPSGDCHKIADIVNKKLKEWLYAAPTAYLDDRGNISYADEYGFNEQVKLVWIEEIEEIEKECVHESSRTGIIASYYPEEIKCKLCGKQLKATWSLK